MTEQAETSVKTDVFAGYVETMEGGPLLGYLVLYSVFDGNVSPCDLALWFDQLGLNKDMLPSPLRADGAFEVATSNTTVTYPLPSGKTATPQPSRQRRGSKAPSRRGPDERTATLMIRRVRRDDQAIVCHLVREVRDAKNTRLKYTDGVAEIVFARDRRPGAAPGAGTLHVTPHLEVTPQREHEQVHELLGTLRTEFERHCRYLTGDKIRAMLRAYIESLNAIKVRPTGGVYFVHQHHSTTLEALRALLERFGAGSHLYRVPLPDQDELRDMVIEAWRTKHVQDLQKLSLEIAAAQHAAAGGTSSTATVDALYKKFRALQIDTEEHSSLLNTDLGETADAMQLAGTQVLALLAQAG
jgi:hypothetical protein